jgi:hypothetical protein
MEIKFAYKVWWEGNGMWGRVLPNANKFFFQNDVEKGERRVGETERREIKRRFLT